MAQKIKIIKYPVGSEPLVLEVRNDLETLQAEVGGPIQPINMGEGLDLMCNEEGLLIPLPFNRVVDGHYIHGDFFLCRHDDEGNTVSVTRQDIEALGR